MKKISLGLLFILSTSLHATIDQGIAAFKNGKLTIAKNILSQTDKTNFQKSDYLTLIAAEKA